jgi:hypothetical protein
LKTFFRCLAGADTGNIAAGFTEFFGNIFGFKNDRGVEKSKADDQNKIEKDVRIAAGLENPGNGQGNIGNELVGDFA